MSNILDEILAHKREELAPRMAGLPLAEIRARAGDAPPRPSFPEALRSAPMGLIAEVKRRSPSAGPIREPFDPVAIATAYEAAGAQAVSVLMDERYFGGGEADFRAVREAVGLPLLYKEFVVDPWQVWHGVAIGASAVLLIVAALDRDDLARLHDVCGEAGVTPLVEVHDEAELATALAIGAAVVGINNRNLKTFVTTLDTSRALLRSLPEEVLAVSESGIRTSEDVTGLRRAGAKAVLVGEHLLREADPGHAVRSLMGDAWACS